MSFQAFVGGFSLAAGASILASAHASDSSAWIILVARLLGALIVGLGIADIVRAIKAEDRRR